MPPSSLLPSQAEMMGAAVCALVESRRSAAAHVTTGRYGDFLKGWWAQYAMVRARIAKEILATRPGTATGQELRELAESESWRMLPDDPRTAVGEVVLERQATNANAGSTGNFSASVIPAGFRFAKHLVTTEISPDQEPAEYVAITSVYADRDDTEACTGSSPAYTHTQRFTVPIAATREGPHANVPYVPTDSQNGLGVCVDAPFDPTLTVKSLRAAGGTFARSETQLRGIARHALLGNKGPNVSALIVGSLLHPGCHRVHHEFDGGAAVAVLFITDESWAYSQAFAAAVKRTLVDGDWIGFGARVDVRGVQVASVSFDVTASLRNPTDLVVAADIEAAIATALTDYFMGDHWYTWSSEGLRGVTAAADRRIKSVESVTMLRAGTGTTVPAPAFVDPAADFLTHWHLRKNGVRVTLGA